MPEQGFPKSWREWVGLEGRKKASRELAEED